MAGPVVVDISSLVRWNKLLAFEAATIAARVEKAVAEQTQAVETNALRDVPVRTGKLKGTIRVTGRGLRQRVRAGSASLGRPYHIFQEFGGRGGAHPFLITQANQQTLAEFERKVQAAVFAGQIMRGGA